MAQGVFAVPVFDKWLIYAPLQQVRALVNRAALDEFPDSLAAALSADSDPEPRPREGAIRPRFLGLIPTRECNLRCAYCGFGATPRGRRMDPRLAAAAVDWMAHQAVHDGCKTLDVHFFGGEQLAAPDVVEVAVHRARAVAAQQGLLPQLEVATNGVYGEARARFVGDYFNTVVLSFDGFRAAHDRHRQAPGGRGSFDQVVSTARLLGASPAGVCFRMCVAEDNVEQLAETVNWFAEEFRPSTIDFETLQPTPESERAGLRAPDPYVFAAHFWRGRRAALHRGVEPVYSAASTDEPRRSFCPLGHDALILEPDGRVSACYLPEREWQARGLDLRLGRFDAGGGMELPAADVQRVRQLAAGKARCRNCLCRWSCAGGCHVNHSFPGCQTGYDDFCIQTRLITACTLLDGLGLESMAGDLVADPTEMRRLALWPSDLRGGA
jgi:uncharacterized protein